MAKPESQRLARGVLVVAATFAVAELFATALGPYGYFIDELYYLACAKRLAFGYVDHPPLSIAILRVTTALFGSSMVAIRLPAVAAMVGTILISAGIAKRLGGGAFAQTLAALATACAPFSLIYASFYSMNAFEALVWSAVLLLLIEIRAGGAPQTWLEIGLLAGLGLENKHTTGAFLAAAAVGVLASPLRAELKSRWPWLAMLIAIGLIAPNLAWQIDSGFPSREFYAAAQAAKNVPTSPLAAIGNQLKIAGPGAFFLWPLGAIWLLASRQGKRWRFAGVTFLLLFVMMIASGSSRPDRIAGIYPLLFAAGAVALESWAAERRLMRWSASVLVGAGGAFVAPVALPCLPFPTAARYAQATGLVPQIERGKTSPLPQPLADRTGWPDLAADVQRVYDALPEADKAGARILCSSYGTAGALELLGVRGGLPPVIATHNGYWSWGPGETAPTVVITVGVGQRVREALLEGDELAATHRCDYCMSWRNDMDIRVGRPKQPWAAAWPAVKHFE